MGQNKAVRINKPIRLIQVTDPHLGESVGYRLSGINTYQSLVSVLESIGEPDMLVVTGDIACNGQAQAYRLFDEIMSDFKLPHCWLPGNHDAFSVMVRNLETPYQSRIRLPGWNLLMLNSTVFNRVNGMVMANELAAIERHLSEDPKTPTLIFSHHPPIAVGCEWLDEQSIMNAEELFEVVAPFSNVKAIFSGHVHQAAEKQLRTIPAYTTPSTCFQFQSNLNTFGIADFPPGYRWIDLFPNGHLKTGIEYLENFQQVADRRCMGY